MRAKQPCGGSPDLHITRERSHAPAHAHKQNVIRSLEKAWLRERGYIYREREREREGESGRGGRYISASQCTLILVVQCTKDKDQSCNLPYSSMLSLLVLVLVVTGNGKLCFYQ